MSYRKEDLIKYRLNKALTTYEEALSLLKSEFWGGAANRLYYSCFYAVIALLAKDDVSASTHTGVRTEFFKRYIKTGILDKSFSLLYSNLMSKRQENDYDDFLEFSEDDIKPLVKEVKFFIDTVQKLAETV